MPVVVGKLDLNIGPLINLDVAAPQGPAGKAPARKTYKGLLDTGAGRTCVSPAIAKDLGLDPKGTGHMRSATQAKKVNMFIVDIFVVMGPLTFTLASHQVLEFEAAPKDFDILVGRDIICQGHLALTFDGHFVFAL